jgi:hypothetical protein
MKKQQEGDSEPPISSGEKKAIRFLRTHWYIGIVGLALGGLGESSIEKIIPKQRVNLPEFNVNLTNTLMELFEIKTDIKVLKDAQREQVMTLNKVKEGLVELKLGQAVSTAKLEMLLSSKVLGANSYSNRFDSMQ